MDPGLSTQATPSHAKRPGNGQPLWRRVVANLGLSVTALVVVFVAAELAVRIVCPHENIPQRQYDELLGWRGRPGLDCVLDQGYFEIRIQQNSDGFRDIERTRDAAPGTTRILCCGDSFTWGWGVEQEAIYTSVLETMYDREGADIEVLNAGVGGYSTDHVLLYLRGEGLSYSPDVVIYQAGRNDVRDNPRALVEQIYSKPVFVLREDGSLDLQGSPVPPLGFARRLKYVISRHSRLAYMLKHRLHVQGLTSGPPPAYRPSAVEGGTEGEAGYAFRLFCRLVAEMDDLCNARGADFVAIIDFALSESESSYWEEVCCDVDARFVAPYLQRREENTGHTACIPGDGHWSEDGHRWIAEFLHDNVLTF